MIKLYNIVFYIILLDFVFKSCFCASVVEIQSRAYGNSINNTHEQAPTAEVSMTVCWMMLAPTTHRKSPLLLVVNLAIHDLYHV